MLGWLVGEGEVGGPVADGAIRLEEKWLAIVPGRDRAEFPRASPWADAGWAARRAGEPSRQSEDRLSPEGLGGHHRLAQTDARRPAGQVMRHHLDGLVSRAAVPARTAR